MKHSIYGINDSIFSERGSQGFLWIKLNYKDLLKDKKEWEGKKSQEQTIVMGDAGSANTEEILVWLRWLDMVKDSSYRCGQSQFLQPHRDGA